MLLERMAKRIAAFAKTSQPTAVAAGDAVELYLDQYGRLHVVDDGLVTPATPVYGATTETGAQSHKELIADPGANKAIHVTGLVITNDATGAITVYLEADTGSAHTALTPTYHIAASGSLSLIFGGPGIVATTHKNVGFTSTGTSNYTVQPVGYAA